MNLKDRWKLPDLKNKDIENNLLKVNEWVTDGFIQKVWVYIDELERKVEEDK